MRKGGPDTRRFPLQPCKLPRGPGPQHLLPQLETNPSLHRTAGDNRPSRVEANDEGKAFLINTCNSQHPSAGRENSSSRCWVLGAPRPGRGPPCAGHGRGKKLPPGFINYVNIPSTALCPQRVAAASPIGGECKCVVEKYSKCHNEARGRSHTPAALEPSRCSA